MKRKMFVIISPRGELELFQKIDSKEKDSRFEIYREFINHLGKSQKIRTYCNNDIYVRDFIKIGYQHLGEL